MTKYFYIYHIHLPLSTKMKRLFISFLVLCLALNVIAGKLNLYLVKNRGYLPMALKQGRCYHSENGTWRKVFCYEGTAYEEIYVDPNCENRIGKPNERHSYECLVLNYPPEDKGTGFAELAFYNDDCSDDFDALYIYKKQTCYPFRNGNSVKVFPDMFLNSINVHIYDTEDCRGTYKVFQYEPGKCYKERDYYISYRYYF